MGVAQVGAQGDRKNMGVGQDNFMGLSATGAGRHFKSSESTARVR